MRPKAGHGPEAAKSPPYISTAQMEIDSESKDDREESKSRDEVGESERKDADGDAKFDDTASLQSSSDSAINADSDFHVFVVDDAQFDLDCISAMCEENDFEVSAFSDWRVALAALERDDCPADLVMVDYHQGDFNAVEFLRTMQLLGRPTVTMSSDNSLQIISECLREDLAADFFVKPVAMRDVARLPRLRMHNSHKGELTPRGRHRVIDGEAIDAKDGVVGGRKVSKGGAYRGRVLQARNDDFHVLIIDDNPFDAECISQMCSNERYSTSQAHSADEADLAIAQRKPDLVLMDWHMPGFDPRLYLHSLKAKQLPAVVMSGDKRNHRVEAALEAGLAADFLPKPLQHHSLSTLPKYKEWTILSMLSSSPHEMIARASTDTVPRRLPPRNSDFVTVRAMRPRSNSTSHVMLEHTIYAPDMDRVLVGVSVVIVRVLSERPEAKVARSGKRSRLQNMFKRSKNAEPANPFDVVDNPDEVSSEAMFKFLKDVYTIARWTPECNVLALVLLMRLLDSSDIRMHAGNWDILVLSSLMISQKIWDDIALSNVDVPEIWRRVYPGRERINLTVVNKLERAFLEALHFDVFVSNATYSAVYFEVHAITTVDHTPDDAPQPLSPLRAAELEEKSASAEVRWRAGAGLLSPEELKAARADAGKWTQKIKSRKLTASLHVIS